MDDPASPRLELFQTHELGQSVVGTIAMCTRDRIHSQTAISWLMTNNSYLGEGEVVSRLIVQGHVLTLQRNECIQRMEGDWILFIDDDMTWQPDAISVLVSDMKEHDLDMVGGLCFQRGEPYQPTLYMREYPTSGGYVFMEDIPDETLVEVDATGMAFMLISKRLLTKIAGEFPAYEDRKHRPPPEYFRWNGGFGEDLQFCQDAKKAGARIFVDTSVKIGHVGEITITEKTFLRELASRDELTFEKRKEQLTALGLRAVPPDEAAQKFRALA